jgi:hypothetical protein
VAVPLTSLIRYVNAVITATGAGKTGLAFGDITAKYLVAGGTLTSLTTETITTLGTYQAPTSAAHIRIKEVSSSDPCKGAYEVHFHDTQLATGAVLELYLSATDTTFERLELDLSNLRARIPDALPNTTNGLTTGDVLGWLTTNVGLLGAALSAIPKTGFKLASDGLAAVVSWTVAITGNITGNLSGSVGSVTGLTPSNLDVAVSSRMATYTQPAGFLAATFPSDPADQSLIIDATNALATLIGDVPTNAELAAALATADDATLAAILAVSKLLRADRKIDKTNPAHWDEVLLEEGTSTELVRRELFDADGTALAAETTRIGRAIKSP